jgi:asparaginyl-tRNA synthetase
VEARSVGGHELAVDGVRVVQNASGYPITPKAHGVDFLMRHRHLWFRSQGSGPSCGCGTR